MFKSVFGAFGAPIQSQTPAQEAPINSQAPSENIQNKFAFSFGKFSVDFLVRGPQRNDTRIYLQPLDEKEATSICEILKNEPVSSVHIKVAFRIFIFLNNI